MACLWDTEGSSAVSQNKVHVKHNWVGYAKSRTQQTSAENAVSLLKGAEVVLQRLNLRAQLPSALHQPYRHRDQRPKANATQTAQQEGTPPTALCPHPALSPQRPKSCTTQDCTTGWLKGNSLMHFALMPAYRHKETKGLCAVCVAAVILRQRWINRCRQAGKQENGQASPKMLSQSIN